MSKQDKARAIINRFISMLTQETDGKIAQSLDPVLNKFAAKNSRYMWKMGQKWCGWNDEGPILMPNNARIFYRKGKTEVILQEFTPQVRTFKYLGTSYALGFPYVIFVHKFKDGGFESTKICFSDRPLKSLQESPKIPYMSNIQSGDLNLCFGTSFDKTKLKKGDYNQQIAYVLDYFWNSEFNRDWEDNLTACQSHFAGTELESLESWQEATARDRLFVVNQDWPSSSYYKQFGDIIVRCFTDDNKDSEIRNEIYDHLNEQLAEEAKEALNLDIKTIANQVLESNLERLSELV